MSQKKKCHCEKNKCGCVSLLPKIKVPKILYEYLRYEDIAIYLKYLAEAHKSFVSLQTIGVSCNNLPISAVVIDWCNEENLRLHLREKKLYTQQRQKAPIAYLPRQHRNRNIILIEAGTHGCEWISISTALCCMQQLIEKNAQQRILLRLLRFVIVPLSNPDGYELSRTKPKWRQNFKGIDCNRNFDINWQDGCNCHTRNTYKGVCAFSEPETRALRNILQILGPQLLMVISLHAYAQTIMYPWGYKQELPKGWEHLRAVASIGRKAIRNYSGRYFRIGSIVRSMNRKISGSFVDYAYDVIKVPFALCMELPARNLGFQPPKNYIQKLSMESWMGLRAMCMAALNYMPTLATERLLRNYEIPKCLGLTNNENILQTNLQQLCEQLEDNLPVNNKNS